VSGGLGAGWRVCVKVAIVQPQHPQHPPPISPPRRALARHDQCSRRSSAIEQALHSLPPAVPGPTATPSRAATKRARAATTRNRAFLASTPETPSSAALWRPFAVLVPPPPPRRICECGARPAARGGDPRGAIDAHFRNLAVRVATSRRPTCPQASHQNGACARYRTGFHAIQPRENPADGCFRVAASGTSGGSRQRGRRVPPCHRARLDSIFDPTPQVKRVGKYEIGKTLGEGTFGKVSLGMGARVGGAGFLALAAVRPRRALGGHAKRSRQSSLASPGWQGMSWLSSCCGATKPPLPPPPVRRR